MPRDPVLTDEHAGPDVRDREEGHRVVTGLVQQDCVLAVHDPLAGELHADAAAQRLGEQQPLRERFGGEEAAGRTDRYRVGLVARTVP